MIRICQLYVRHLPLRRGSDSLGDRKTPFGFVSRETWWTCLHERGHRVSKQGVCCGIVVGMQTGEVGIAMDPCLEHITSAAQASVGRASPPPVMKGRPGECLHPCFGLLGQQGCVARPTCVPAQARNRRLIPQECATATIPFGCELQPGCISCPRRESQHTAECEPRLLLHFFQPDSRDLLERRR